MSYVATEPTVATLNRFVTCGMPDEGADCDSCGFRTGTEKVYRIDNAPPEWTLLFAALCDRCVTHPDVIVRGRADG